MDATQAIVFSDEESEEEREPGQKKAVAFLHILAQKDLAASKHPIYEGDNFIGRHDSNSIHMPYKALSKQHACIEVQGNSHLIYDMESRNKTRRGKMFLKPNVRYELRDSDVIIFGDVKCQYIAQPEEDDDDDDETGSETDSELMLQRPDSEDTGQDDKYSKEDENENDSSFNLNDFLQPTQPCVESPKLQFKTPRRLDEGKVYAADSDEESPNKSDASGYEEDSFIPETQLSAKKKNDFSVVEESDSDTDIDETGPFDISALASAQTQAVVATQAVENMATQAVDGMETQAIDNMATLAVDNMATLTVDNIETQAVDGMATQALDNMETQAIDNMATLATDNMATQAVDNMQTQAIDNMATLAVGNTETQAIDNMATLAVDNMTTQAVDNMATQAVDYSADSDSSDTDLDEVGQSMLEAPTQAVGQNDSRQHGPPKKYAQTLVLDSSTASSDVDDSPVKQTGSGRNIFDEPTQVCDDVVSDSGSETDIEEGGMEEETQAVIRDDENKIDEMATVAIGQDDDDDDATDEEETMETDSKMLSSNKTGDVENMATVPIEMDDDDTDVEDNENEGVKVVDSKMIDTTKITDVEDIATVPVAMADDDDDHDTDAEEGKIDDEEKSAIEDTKMKGGNSDVTREERPKLAPSDPDRDDDNIEMESEMIDGSQEYFLNYRTEQNPGPCDVEATQPYQGPSDVEATQPYQGLSDDASAEDAPSNNPGDDVVFDATQPYGAINEDETPEEPTIEMSSTQPYGAGGENKEPCSRDDETEPTLKYGAEEDIAMETGDSEIESTQAYGIQGYDTQVPDSQDGDDQATTSSRFPVFKTQSPSRSCLKQPNTPERNATKARRVTFEPADDEEGGQSDESDGESETQKSSRWSQRQPKNNKSSVAPKSQSSSTGARRSRSKVSQRNNDEELDATTKNDTTPGRRSTRSKAENDEVIAKPGQKRKVGSLEPVAADSSAQTTKDESAKRGKRQRGGKVGEEPDGDLKTVDELLTTTDAKPTRKKEFDAENPRPSSRRGSKVKDERKLSDSSISSVGSEGSRTGRALQTIVQIGKKITRISKKGKKTSQDSEESSTVKPVSDSVGTRRSQKIAEVVDDGDSDDTASISSIASSIRDFAEVEPSTRPTRGTRKQKISKKVVEEHDGPSTSGPGARRSRRGGTGKEETSDSQDSEKKAGSRTRREVAMETVETEVDGQSTQSSRRTQRRGGTKGDETASQDDRVREVSKRVGKGDKTDSQNDGEVRSKRTKRVTVPEVKPNTQEEEPVRNKSRTTVELPSDAIKLSTRGKTKAKISGDGDQGVHEDKESRDTSSRRSRRTTSESQEKSTKETEETNVRHSARRRTVPARFIDSEGTDKATGSQRPSSKQEAKDTSSTDAGVFAVPKAVGRPSRHKQQKESSSSPQKEIEAGTVQTSSRGKQSSANVAEASVEKKQSKLVEEDSKESKKRGRHVHATKPDTFSNIGESKAEENTTTVIHRGRRATTKISEADEKGKAEQVKEHSREPTKRGKQVLAVKQDKSSNKEESAADENTPKQRGRRATTKLSEASALTGKSEDVKEAASSSSKRGRQVTTPKQKPEEDSAADDSMATPAPRGRRAAAPASKTSKDSKDIARHEQDMSTEVVKTRGKRGAAATPPQSSPAKKPRQATLPTSRPSPSASPARTSRQQTDQMAALSPSLRRRVSDVRPKVMFTGVMDESWQKTVTTLGGELVDTVHHCTHLITDKVRRTVKFLCCVARGVIIVTPNWLDESKAAKMFIDAGPFQLKDKASERQHGFNLMMSLQKAGQATLLKGYKIHVTPGVKPEPQQMKDIIKCAGGEYVAKLPTKSIPQMVVVSCDGDKSLWMGPTKAGIPVVSSEFILTGILRQDILLKDYKLK